MLEATDTSVARVAERLMARNRASRLFFPGLAPGLAELCREMAGRFLEGGRLLAFGRGAYATDAQHVAVEFVHPVIVGKRALPALDVSADPAGWLRTLLQPTDMVMRFGPPGGDPELDALVAGAQARGALAIALPGRAGPCDVPPASADPFVHQELIEILYHTLWETVHVFFEHREHGHDAGEASFLYPFLGPSRQDTGAVTTDVAASIVAKAREVERLRDVAARDQARPLADVAAAVAARLRDGGRIVAFGNGGSATDANDFALDCVSPPAELGYRPLPALSLALDPANLSAVANDIGAEALFLRPLIAHGRPGDVAVAFSTSGNSANIAAALVEARRMGLRTVAFLGYDGGEIARRGLADDLLVVDCDYIPRIQEVHASMYHILRELMEEALHA